MEIDWNEQSGENGESADWNDYQDVLCYDGTWTEDDWDGDWWYDESYDWSQDWSWYDDSSWHAPDWTPEVQ